MNTFTIAIWKMWELCSRLSNPNLMAKFPSRNCRQALSRPDNFFSKNGSMFVMLEIYNNPTKEYLIAERHMFSTNIQAVIPLRNVTFSTIRQVSHTLQYKSNCERTYETLHFSTEYFSFSIDDAGYVTHHSETVCEQIGSVVFL